MLVVIVVMFSIYKRRFMKSYIKTKANIFSFKRWKRIFLIFSCANQRNFPFKPKVDEGQEYGYWFVLAAIEIKLVR